jgi:hypothetical protein
MLWMIFEIPNLWHISRHENLHQTPFEYIPLRNYVTMDPQDVTAQQVVDLLERLVSDSSNFHPHLAE